MIIALMLAAAVAIGVDSNWQFEHHESVTYCNDSSVCTELGDEGVRLHR